LSFFIFIFTFTFSLRVFSENTKKKKKKKKKNKRKKQKKKAKTPVDGEWITGMFFTSDQASSIPLSRVFWNSNRLLVE